MPLILFGLLLARGAPSAGHADLFDELFARLQPQQASLRTVRARFVETTTSSLLREPLVARGLLRAERPSKLRLDYDAPEARTLIAGTRQLVLDWPSRGEHSVRDISRAQQRVQKYFVSKDPAELRRHFDIRAFVDQAVPGTWQVDMMPRQKQIREGLTRLQIWIDQRTEFMRQMRMTFAGGDTKTVAIENPEINVPLPDAVFGAP